jgi:hypothetical protein
MPADTYDTAASDMTNHKRKGRSRWPRLITSVAEKRGGGVSGREVLVFRQRNVATKKKQMNKQTNGKERKEEGGREDLLFHVSIAIVCRGMLLGNPPSTFLSCSVFNAHSVVAVAVVLFLCSPYPQRDSSLWFHSRIVGVVSLHCHGHLPSSSVSRFGMCSARWPHIVHIVLMLHMYG